MITDRQLAILAKQAYTQEPTWRAGDVHAVRTGNIIAFRGTMPDNLADWVRDIEAWPSNDPHLGRVHTGFRDGAYATLLPILRDKGRDDAKITFVGHSLGGALAILTAAYFRAMGLWPDALVTFGAPRAGGGGLRDLLRDVPVRQYRNGNDPVPTVPWLPGVYTHLNDPLIAIGHDWADPIEAHVIDHYIQELPSLVTAPKQQAA